VTEEIGELDESNSWALTGVPMTVYTQAPRGAVRPAEAVVHESAHNLLNAVLHARDVRFADQPVWYSPWKRTDRPAFGIVHAIFAFSALVDYWDAVLARPDIGERMRGYCRMRLDSETRILATMGETVDACLSQTGDPVVRGLVEQVAAQALQVGAVSGHGSA
jgi:HEXXH motif-containing protein